MPNERPHGREGYGHVGCLRESGSAGHANQHALSIGPLDCDGVLLSFTNAQRSQQRLDYVQDFIACPTRERQRMR